MRICRTGGRHATVRAPSCQTALILRRCPANRPAQGTVRRPFLGPMTPRGGARIRPHIAARMTPRGAARTRPRGGATARRTGRPTQPPATAARAQGTLASRGIPAAPGPAAARGIPEAPGPAAAQGRALARGPTAGRRPVARGQRHAPVRTGRCAAPSPRPTGLPRQAVRKLGPVVLARIAAGGSTGNPALPRPFREAPRGRPRPYRTAEPSRRAGLPPARKTRRGSPARPRLARPARTMDPSCRHGL